VKQLRKKVHPSFWTLDYNYQHFESGSAHAVAMICCQGHCSQENGDTSAEKRSVSLWFNKTNV
jgi:hypothetical protein